jgi:molybdate transport system substrate-binding protein
MTIRGLRRISVRLSALAVFAIVASAAASAEELRVMTSGAFKAALVQLMPGFERASGNTVVVIEGASMGDGPTTIPNRLARGEAADVVILADEGVRQLIARGLIAADGRIELVRSSIGMAVRAGAPQPDISSVAALTRTLLAAKSIAYSSSASGVYLSTELFPRLGIADRIRDKARRIDSGPVAAVVARGEAEIGFQQISELLPVPGIDIVGPLPPGAQRVTVFSAGLVANARQGDAARALIAFITSSASAGVIRKTGLEPISSANPQ